MLYNIYYITCTRFAFNKLSLIIRNNTANTSQRAFNMRMLCTYVCHLCRHSFVVCLRRENRIAKTNWYKISNFLRRAHRNDNANENVCNASQRVLCFANILCWVPIYTTSYYVYGICCTMYVICANIHHVSAYVALVCITLNGPEAVCKLCTEHISLGAPPELAGWLAMSDVAAVVAVAHSLRGWVRCTLTQKIKNKVYLMSDVRVVCEIVA